jgi:hypothetical protein
MGKLAKIEIMFDGATWTDVTAYCQGFNYTGHLNNQADTINSKFAKTLKTDYPALREWLPIRYSEGWVTSTDRVAFKGIITRIKSEYDYIHIDGADDIYKLLKDDKTAVYNDDDIYAGKISAIAEDIMDEIVPTNVEDSGTSVVLTQFVTSYKTNRLERASVLARILDWIILFDPESGSNGEAYFVPKGYWENTRVINIPTDVTERPKWDSDSTQLFNIIRLIGGTSSGVRTKLFTGDGAEDTFSIDFTPSDSVLVEVYDGADWIEQVQGTPGVSETFDYSIDKFNKQIIFEAASIPPALADSVRVTVSAQIPPIVKLRNDSSIVLYNKGENEDGLIGISKTVIEPDIKNNTDAYTRAKNLLSTYSWPFLSTQLKLTPTADYLGNYKLGERVYVTDADYGLTNREFIITEIERSWPGGGAIITVGDRLYKTGGDVSDIRKRLEQLEGELAGDFEILAEFQDVSHELELVRNTLSFSTYAICDSFILDHDVNGLIEDGKILDDFESGFAANWSTSNCSLAEETTEYQTGVMSCEITPTDNCSIITTQSFGDLSEFTGVNSGTPSQGTIGLWVNNNTSTISEVRLKIGSDSSNYAYYTASIYASDLGFDWQDDWTYLLFDLDNPDSVEGTPDWTTCDYAVIEIDLSSIVGVIYIDYFTISGSNYRGLNGLGERIMEL